MDLLIVTDIRYVYPIVNPSNRNRTAKQQNMYGAPHFDTKLQSSPVRGKKMQMAPVKTKLDHLSFCWNSGRFGQCDKLIVTKLFDHIIADELKLLG